MALLIDMEKWNYISVDDKDYGLNEVDKLVNLNGHNFDGIMLEVLNIKKTFPDGTEAVKQLTRNSKVNLL